MNGNLNMDVIRSALLAGEIDDAYKVIFNAKKRIELYKSTTGDSRYDVYYGFISLIDEVVKGRRSWKDLRSYTDENFEKLSAYVDPDFLESFPYYLFFSIDRYNVRFPYYDGKRCDDR
ncbi:hypothetical protein DMB44_05805 [Thermoplasma sp. Kam2015]|uniref:hypothetical protein n=1 Tax=Thermoplasma sp. Kam2015 TaxID=2094122 RepID=UPI000D8AE7E2|nr:hypothetical protein [Thermoplasma sp. Kam2015]PYB68016.1 hypothetical protein DMB44_05805 [Thermoplasma sp. Kam2015]